MHGICKYAKGSSLVLALSLLTMRVPVFATATTSNAVQDIMNDARFQGAISSIEWLTNFIDHYFTIIISVTAFFIISAALLKNVCAGAYVANHKFWDKVAEAHEKADAVSLAGIKDYFGGKQFMQTGAGSIKDALLCFVPNIKALTDFDDADIEPKAYFMKAIPQMLVCVIIGVFIYNGYYRDTASAVGSFGSEICNRVFASVDPASFVDKITLTTKTPDNIYESDQTLQGQDTYAISSAIYKVIISNATGLTEETSKEKVMRTAESLAYQLTSSEAFQSKFYSDARLYDFSTSNLKVTLTLSIPDNYSGSFSSPYVAAVSDSSDSQYTVTCYQDFTSEEWATYLGEYKFIYLSTTMKGSSRSDSTEGKTSTTPSQTSWTDSTVDPIVLSVKASVVDSKDSDGNALYSTSNVAISSLISTTALEQKVKEYCSANSVSYIDGTISVESYSGYNAGSGQKPCIKFNKVNSGATINVTASVAFKATSDGTSSRTYTLKVPITFQLQP
jgi:hypothetical protein